MRTIAQVLGALLLALPLAASGPAAAQTMFHRAENGIPVAVVPLIRTAQYTEFHIQAIEARTQVCWETSGPDSPYLLADGRRYRLVGMVNVAACPRRADVAAQEIMRLQFEPLPAGRRVVSLVEGQGGENQMIDPNAQRGLNYWNFLRIEVQ